METVETLRGILETAQTGAPEASVENAIMVYQAAQAAIDAYNEVKDAAKLLISEVMAETGETKYSTRAGVVQVTAPSVTVSYDAKALDVLCKADADLAVKLFAYRKESQRAGGLRIAAAK